MVQPVEQTNLHTKVAGEIKLSFVVEPDGTISNVTLLNGISYGYDEEALKLLAASPRWKPGIKKDIAVRTFCTIPILINQYKSRMHGFNGLYLIDNKIAHQEELERLPCHRIDYVSGLEREAAKVKYGENGAILIVTKK